jgi:hypothetical protein
MFHDLLLLVYRRSSPSPLHPQHPSNIPFGQICVAQPLRCRHTLGLLPFVKELWIHDLQGRSRFSPRLFNSRTLRQFSALTNVCELGIEYLNIPSFMPMIRRYFQHFLPTVRSLALKSPKGSRRQVIYFIGLFKHLEDLELLYDRMEVQEEPADDQTLVPPSVPPLRGWLTMVYCTRGGPFEGHDRPIWRDPVSLHGSFRRGRDGAPARRLRRNVDNRSVVPKR